MTTKTADAFKQKIAASDARIEVAKEVLASHHRGREVAAQLAAFLKGPASGLDSQGHNAVASLINEFKDGRRDFVHDLLHLKGGE